MSHQMNPHLKDSHGYRPYEDSPTTAPVSSGSQDGPLQRVRGLSAAPLHGIHHPPCPLDGLCLLPHRHQVSKYF